MAKQKVVCSIPILPSENGVTVWVCSLGCNHIAKISQKCWSQRPVEYECKVCPAGEPEHEVRFGIYKKIEEKENKRNTKQSKPDVKRVEVDKIPEKDTRVPDDLNDFEKFVWSSPMPQLALDLGISPLTLRKRCKLIGARTPPVGFWSRK